MEFAGENGELGYNSTHFEYELAGDLMQAVYIIRALLDQVEEYSTNEIIIGKNNTYSINEIKKIIGDTQEQEIDVLEMIKKQVENKILTLNTIKRGLNQ